MAQTIQAKIGFISPAGAASAHLEGFRALVPQGVRMDLEGLGLKRNSFNDFQGKTAIAIKRIRELVRQWGWQGVMVGGAPFELMNPGLAGDLRDGLEVPVTTALGSCVAAIRAFSAQKVLLMTPFDDSMNRMIRDYLADCEIEAISPPQAFSNYKDAVKQSPEDVYSMAEKAVEGVQDVQAIYFQGGVLDPLRVLERMERELHTTVVASNPAMLWCVLAKLGFSYQVRGYGKLLEEWRKVP